MVICSGKKQRKLTCSRITKIFAWRARTAVKRKIQQNVYRGCVGSWSEGEIASSLPFPVVSVLLLEKKKHDFRICMCELRRKAVSYHRHGRSSCPFSALPQIAAISGVPASAASLHPRASALSSCRSRNSPSSLNCYFKSDASWEIVSCKSLRTTGEHSTLCAFPSVQSHTTGEKRGGFRQESQNLKKMNKRRTSNLRRQTPSPTGHPVTRQAQGNVTFSNLFFSLFENHLFINRASLWPDTNTTNHFKKAAKTGRTQVDQGGGQLELTFRGVRCLQVASRTLCVKCNIHLLHDPMTHLRVHPRNVKT